MFQQKLCMTVLWHLFVGRIFVQMFFVFRDKFLFVESFLTVIICVQDYPYLRILTSTHLNFFNLQRSATYIIGLHVLKLRSQNILLQINFFYNPPPPKLSCPLKKSNLLSKSFVIIVCWNTWIWWEDQNHEIVKKS